MQNQREIKFRVWTVIEERMFVVDTLYFDKGLIGLYAEYKDETKISGKFGIASPDNYVLMQYTGLKDKNGKEIYEGDIVKIDWDNHEYVKDRLYEVKYFECVAAFQLGNLLSNGDSGADDIIEFELETNEHLEKIGNIYENNAVL